MRKLGRLKRRSARRGEVELGWSRGRIRAELERRQGGRRGVRDMGCVEAGQEQRQGEYEGTVGAVSEFEQKQCKAEGGLEQRQKLSRGSVIDRDEERQEG
jgi:hypothetical protein